ncbi:MAG: RNA methyltransferase [Actinomycetota bacterium]|nr:RNA methyltransferase [Actinomycetota bacterium]
MITSPDNEKLKLIRKLRQRKHRDREGLFVTEGEDLARTGIAAGIRPRALLIHPDLEETDLGEVGETVEPDLLDRASGLGSGSRVIGIWPQAKPADIPQDGICIYLDGLSDPGNMGTIIRTVDALLEATVVVAPGSVDHYAPGSVRASMGSIFTQPVVRARIERTPQPRIATVPRDGERPGPHAAPVTVVLGAEREGLSPEMVNLCESRWTVPLRQSGAEPGAESLNVAAAAAIVCERISSPGSPGSPAASGTESG